MLNFITWTCDPVAFSLFGLEIRWYGVMFALAFICGWFLLSKMFKKEGRDPALADVLLWYVAIAVIIGARLGHCLFYEPSYYLSHPIDILKIRDGGLASHGAAVSIPIALWLVSRKYRISIWYLLDRVVIVVALSGLFIRMGNLFNSEIYGHVTSLPWGFIFANNGEVLPKHPTQIYEALSYFILFCILLAVYRKKQGKLRNGSFFGWFLIACFSMRFLIEFVKEVQVSWENKYWLDMGQMLSIPFIVLGIVMVVLSHRMQLGKMDALPGAGTPKPKDTNKPPKTNKPKKQALMILALGVGLVGGAQAQYRLFGGKKVVQFSGVVVSGVDTKPLPFTTIYIENRNRGGIADANGYFSFVAVGGDSVRFSSVGYQTRYFIIPDTSHFDSYSVVIPLEQDTVMLLEAVVYPWPSKEKFRDAFINLELPDNDAEIIQKNFNLATMREQARAGKMDANMNYRSIMQQQSQRLYYQNQQAPNNLLNPFAWARFIKQWQRKRKADKLEKQNEGYKDYETDYDYLPNSQNPDHE